MVGRRAGASRAPCANAKGPRSRSAETRGRFPDLLHPEPGGLPASATWWPEADPRPASPGDFPRAPHSQEGRCVPAWVPGLRQRLKLEPSAARVLRGLAGRHLGGSRRLWSYGAWKFANCTLELSATTQAHRESVLQEPGSGYCGWNPRRPGEQAGRGTWGSSGRLGRDTWK